MWALMWVRIQKIPAPDLAMDFQRHLAPSSGSWGAGGWELQFSTLHFTSPWTITSLCHTHRATRTQNCIKSSPRRRGGPAGMVLQPMPGPSSVIITSPCLAFPTGPLPGWERGKLREQAAQHCVFLTVKCVAPGLIYRTLAKPCSQILIS